jgi:hypothetical protein
LALCLGNLESERKCCRDLDLKSVTWVQWLLMVWMRTWLKTVWGKEVQCWS